MHCHFRQEEMLELVVPETARYARYGIAMPNTVPPVRTGFDAMQYKDEILRANIANDNFKPLMTIKIFDTTTAREIREAKKAGVVAGKIYPLGVTTNAEDGFTDFLSESAEEIFGTMEEEEMLLLIHGEINMKGKLMIEREGAFLPTLILLANRYKNLKIVLEHVSSEEGVNVVKKLGSNVAATITAHHLVLTNDDTIGKPHNVCMPIAKYFHDRAALREEVLNGNPKFFLGSDSAPHPKDQKECAEAKSGIFIAHALPQILSGIFYESGRNDWVERFENFTSTYAAKFYGLPLCEEKITLIKEQWKVPEMYGPVVPFMAGKMLDWKLSA